MTAALWRIRSRCGGGSRELGILHAHRQHRRAVTTSRHSYLVHCSMTTSHRIDFLVIGHHAGRRLVPCTPPTYPVVHDAVQGVLAEVLAAASRILGAPVKEDQPLMEAGLDSLGAHEANTYCGPDKCVSTAGAVCMTLYFFGVHLQTRMSKRHDCHELCISMHRAQKVRICLQCR